MPKVTIDYEKGEDLNDVLDLCPAGVFEKQDDKIVVAHEDQCTACHACDGTHESIKVEDD